jgi:hypothetical protein
MENITEIHMGYVSALTLLSSMFILTYEKKIYNTASL